MWRLVREETHHPRLQTTPPSTSLVRSGSADFGEAQQQMSKHQKNARDNFEEQLLRLPSDSLGCPWLLEFQEFQAKASVKIIHIGMICSIHRCASHLLQTIGTRSVEKGGKCVRKVAWNWYTPVQLNWWVVAQQNGSHANIRVYTAMFQSVRDTLDMPRKIDAQNGKACSPLLRPASCNWNGICTN